MNEVDCWQTAASEALQDIWFTNTRCAREWVDSEGRIGPGWLGLIDALVPDLEEVIDSPDYLGKTFCIIGANVVAAFPQLSFAHVLDTVIGKQRDYGHGNILRYGLTGVVVRMADKIERMKNLQGKEAVNESIEDTALDIIGYCLIAVMLLAGTFTKELA